MDILTDFITAAPTRKSWSTVYGYRPDKQSELKLLGEMFAVLSIKSDVEYDLANLGDLLLDELQAAYFKPTNEPAGLTDFEFALKAMNKRLETILEREEHLAKKGIDFEMMLAVIREGIIYLGVVGESKVVIARESDIAEISSALIDPDMEGFFRSGTLQLMSSDRILLLTSDAYKQLKQEGSEAVLNEFLLNKTVAKPKGSVIMLGYDLDADWLARLEERNAPKQDPVPLDPETQEVESDRLEDLEPITPEEHIQEQEEVEDYEQGFEEEFTEEDDYEEGEQYAQNEPEPHSPIVRLKGAFATAKNKFAGAAGSVVGSLKDGKAVKGVLATAGATLKDIKNGRPGSRAEYMRGGKRGGIAVPQRWKLLGVIFLIAMVVVVFGVRQTIADNERRAYEQGVLDQVAKLEQDYSALEVRVNTVSIGTGQDAEKERIIRDLDQLKQKAEQLKSDQLAIDRIDKVIADSDKQKDTILKINAFSQAQVVTDLGVNFPDVNAVSLGYSQGQLYLLDKARGTIYRTATTIQSQAASFVTGLNSPKVMGVKEDGNLVFIDSGSESVVGVVDIATGDIRRQPGLSADRIGNVANIFIWPQNGSMYSINLTRNAIVRQSTVAGNYQIPGDGSVWRQDPEFANAIDLAVDGSVYVLVKGKGIQRYWGGEPATFTLGGMLSNIRQGVSDAVAFELTSTRIYVADAKNKRILIFALAPEGEANYQFLEQIVYRGSENIFNDIRDIVVVPGEQGERLFVLDGSKVIRIDR